MSHALVATFDGPARAIRCAQKILAAAQHLGISLGAGVHTGECDLHHDTLTGDTVAIGDAGRGCPAR